MAGTGVPRGARALWRLGSALPCLGKVGGQLLWLLRWLCPGQPPSFPSSCEADGDAAEQ